jgi:hypothetical protein
VPVGRGFGMYGISDNSASEKARATPRKMVNVHIMMIGIYRVEWRGSLEWF